MPENDLAKAQELTGVGVTEAIEKLASVQVQHELLKLRGTFKFSLSLDELREDREWLPSIHPR